MQIVAIAGGGFSVGDADLAMERYLLSLTGKAHPCVCFIPTASADSEVYTLRFYRAFAALGAAPDDLSLFKGRTADIADLLCRQDLIFVGGGNTRSMLALWREWGLGEALRQAGEAGAILSGVSGSPRKTAPTRTAMAVTANSTLIARVAPIEATRPK